MKERFFIRIVSLCAVFFAAGIAFGEAPAVPPPAPQLREPAIAISPDYFYPFEDILYLAGRSAPNAIITVVLQKQGDKPVKFTVTPDSSGEWVVNEKTYLSAGDWEVRARAQLGSELSDWSNPRIIRSVVTGISVFGLRIRYIAIGAFVFIFLLILAGVFIYFTRTIRKLKRGLFEKQVHETRDRAHESFIVLRRELTERLKSLVANADKRPLTLEEIDQQERILRELDELEQRTEHDIGDIEHRY